MTNIQPNPNIQQINAQKYKSAMSKHFEEAEKEFKKSQKKWRKWRKFNIWFNLGLGSLMISWVTYWTIKNISEFNGLSSILTISLNFLCFGIWTWLIYGAFKDRQQMKIDDREDMLKELEK